MENPSIDANGSVTADQAICVHHLMRSGGHGLVNWLWPQFPKDKRIIHINNFDPEITLYEHASKPWKYGSPFEPMVGQPRGLYFATVGNEIRGLIGARVDAFVYTCEDFDPEWKCPYVQSDNHKTVILLRDPYNWLASRLEGFRGLYPRYADRISGNPLPLWKKHARMILDDPTVVPVLFNRWYSLPSYRASISEALGLAFTDEAFEGNADVRKSSFGENHKDGVLERWKHFISNPFYRSLFDDEIIALADELFPETVHIREELGF